jgi:formate transporter
MEKDKPTSSNTPPNTDSSSQPGIDALLPKDMAQKAEVIGISKAKQDFISTFALAVLAGSFIALGALFATTALTGTSGAVPFGWARVIAGLVFSLGLILVIVGGAELFTGNILIVMAWLGRHCSSFLVLRNWSIVYIGNFVGAVTTALLVFWSKQYTFSGGAVGATALNIGLSKVNLGFFQAIMLGILCNALVCLAVWLCYSARSTVDKIAAIILPITAFVAAGFEHSIANMFFIPIALFIKDWAPDSFWQTSGLDPSTYANLNWGSFLYHNLLPVTIGNIIGGGILVGAVYWLVYLRKRRS